MKDHPNSKFHKQDIPLPGTSSLEIMAELTEIHKLKNVAKGIEQLHALRERLKLNPGFESAGE